MDIPIYSNSGLKNIPLFIDKHILTKIREYSWKLSELRSCLKEDLFVYKHSAIVDFSYPTAKPKVAKESLKEYLDNGQLSDNAKKYCQCQKTRKLYILNL